MELKVKKKVIFEVDYNDFENFVNEVYNTNFDFVSTQEANNYSKYSFNPEKMIYFNESNILDREIKLNHENLRRGILNKNISVHDIFDCLLTDGLIEEGEYIVDVSW